MKYCIWRGIVRTFSTVFWGPKTGCTLYPEYENAYICMRKNRDFGLKKWGCALYPRAHYTPSNTVINAPALRSVLVFARGCMLCWWRLCLQQSISFYRACLPSKRAKWNMRYGAHRMQGSTMASLPWQNREHEQLSVHLCMRRLKIKHHRRDGSSAEWTGHAKTPIPYVGRQANHHNASIACTAGQSTCRLESLTWVGFILLAMPHRSCVSTQDILPLANVDS